MQLQNKLMRTMLNPHLRVCNNYPQMINWFIENCNISDISVFLVCRVIFETLLGSLFFHSAEICSARLHKCVPTRTLWIFQVSGWSWWGCINHKSCGGLGETGPLIDSAVKRDTGKQLSLPPCFDLGLILWISPWTAPLENRKWAVLEAGSWKSVFASSTSGSEVTRTSRPFCDLCTFGMSFF